MCSPHKKSRTLHTGTSIHLLLCVRERETETDTHVQIQVTKNTDWFFISLPRSLTHPNTVTDTQICAKLTKANADLCFPLLKETSLRKGNKFNQRIGTHTQTKTHSTLAGNGLLTAQCLKQTRVCAREAVDLVTARYRPLSP